MAMCSLRLYCSIRMRIRGGNPKKLKKHISQRLTNFTKSSKIPSTQLQSQVPIPKPPPAATAAATLTVTKNRGVTSESRSKV